MLEQKKNEISENTDKWSIISKGCLQRGLTMADSNLVHQEIDEPDESTSFMWWGVLWITNVDIVHVVDVIKDLSDQLPVVDNIDDNTICIKLQTCQSPMIINMGPTPRVASQAELKDPPHGSWYHFQYNSDRQLIYQQLIYQQIDKLYDLFPQSRIYIMACLHPLNLIHIMMRAQG